jgi:hypothetical protein
VLTCSRSPPSPTLTTGINRPSLPLLYVAYVCFKCFRSFRCMLQLFHMDVAKVDRGCCTCCNCFRGMLQAYVLSVSDVSEVCFICGFRTHVASVFIWISHMFHTYVACVLFGYCVWLQWFSSVLEACFKCFNCL